MPSGLREVRDLPPEGDPQFPPNGPAQHHLSQAGSVQASRYGPSGKQGSGESHREKADYSVVLHALLAMLAPLSIAPRPCSQRLDAQSGASRKRGSSRPWNGLGD